MIVYALVTAGWYSDANKLVSIHATKEAARKAAEEHLSDLWDDIVWEWYNDVVVDIDGCCYKVETWDADLGEEIYE